MPKNYYKILGVDQTADKDEIKQAYRTLAKKFHPDVNKTPGADEIFIEITEAYEVLMSLPESSEQREIKEDYYSSFDKEYWDKVRKRAEEQARMKYEKFVKQHEAFKESGIYDISLIFKIIGRVLLLFIALLFFTIPIIGSISYRPLIFMAFLMYPIAIFITFYIYEKRKNYFIPGKFYYNFNRIMNYYKETDNRPLYNCFYCQGEKGNSKPYKIYLLKIKDVKLDNMGPVIHQASYKRTYKTVRIPRSQKALINHSISSVIKFVCFFILPFLVPLNSFLWKMIISILCGILCSEIFLFLVKTRSKVGYLLNRSLLLKALIWTATLIVLTDFSNGFLNLVTYDAVITVFTLLILFDPVYEQLVKISKNNGFNMLKPMLPYYSELNKYFDKRYQYYLDVPFWTIIYPIFKWIFG